jgi:hypothetical protein
MKLDGAKKFIALAAALVSFIILCFTGVIKFDSRVDQKIEKEVGILEEDVTQSLEQFQTHQDLRHYNQRIEIFQDQEDRVQKELRRNPEDEDLSKDLDDIKKKKQKAQEHLNELLK